MIPSNKKITIVIPSRNSVRLSNKTIENISLLKDKHKILLSIVDESDDGISDRYAEKLCRHYDIDYTIKRYHGLGFDKSLYQGLTTVDTEFCSFFTLTDLFCNPCHISDAIKILSLYKHLFFFHSNILTLIPTDVLIPGLANRYQYSRFNSSILRTNYIGAGFYANLLAVKDGINELTSVFRTNILKEILKYVISDERFKHNLLYGIFYYTFSSGYVGYHSDDYNVIGRQHDDSKTANPSQKDAEIYSRDNYESVYSLIRSGISDGSFRFRSANPEENIDDFHQSCMDEYFYNYEQLLHQNKLYGCMFQKE